MAPSVEDKKPDKKPVLDLLDDAIKCVKQAEQIVKKERLIESRLIYGNVVPGLDDSAFHLKRLKYWIEHEREWPKRGGKQ